MEKKVFISHSSNDKDFVEKIIDLLEAMGINQKRIFCSSFEGYGIPLGENYLERIKKELNTEVTVIFVFSENFYSSVISICEMGATWVKTNMHIPILIPPFGDDDIKGVFPLSRSMKINEFDKWNSLYKQLKEADFIENTIDFNIWERKRNSILESIEDLIKKSLKPINKVMSKQVVPSNKEPYFWDKILQEISDTNNLKLYADLRNSKAMCCKNTVFIALEGEFEFKKIMLEKNYVKYIADLIEKELRTNIKVKFINCDA